MNGVGDVIMTFVLAAVLAMFVEFPLIPNKENFLKSNQVISDVSLSTDTIENVEMNSAK